MSEAGPPPSNRTTNVSESLQILTLNPLHKLNNCGVLSFITLIWSLLLEPELGRENTF
jgi:hypothetical protein